MNRKQIVALAVGIVALAVSVWKGPGAWATASHAVDAACLFALPLLGRDPKLAGYVSDLETALEEKSPGAPAAMRAARRLPARSPARSPS